MYAFAYICLWISCWIILTKGDECGAWWHGDRCKWTGWEQWSSCSLTCGGGTRHRSRGLCCKHDQSYDDCLKACNKDRAPASQSENCNTVCVHGRYVGSSCSCPDEYYGYCCSESCPDINNCQHRRCTHRYVVQCVKCNNDNVYYKRTAGNTRCERMCEWDNPCWPGRCDNQLTSACRCDSGFTADKSSGSTQCELLSSSRPTLDTCRLGAENIGHQIVNSTRGTVTDCEHESSTFTAIQPARVSFKLKSSFRITTQSNAHAYIGDHVFGVVNNRIRMFKVAFSGAEHNIVHRDLNAPPYCVSSFSDSKPATGPASCDFQFTGTHLQNGEKLCMEFTAFAGGFLKTIKHGSPGNTHTYRHTSKTKQLCLKFDDKKPEHCKVLKTCTGKEPLQLSDRITNKSTIKVSFAGWVDPIPFGGRSSQTSGLKEFRITLLPTKELGSKNLTVDYPAVDEKKLPASHTFTTLAVPNPKSPALYSVVLEAHDIAGNMRMARRFFIYDNSSHVAVNNLHKLKATSASSVTNYTWQIHHGDICVDWRGRYYNSFHINYNLLRNITKDGNITGPYDQENDELPITGTLNVDGITKFMYNWQLDRNPRTPVKRIPIVRMQSFCEKIPVNDGETYKFWIMPQDINGRSKTEDITVHIDASVPLIQDVWLVKGNHRQLYVHDSHDLSKMILEFKALDIHGGLYSIRWLLGTARGGRDIGSGHLAVNKLLPNATNACLKSDTDCYCPKIGPCEYFTYRVTLNGLVANGTHEGQHNRGYFFTIIVTNNAQLVNVERIDVLADDSPPVPGVIQEGKMGSPDVDYTSNDIIMVSWDGFIDHESGLRVYVVSMAKKCLLLNELESGPVFAKNLSIRNTTNKAIAFKLSETGTYFSSIIAYNNAMEPSKVICSDGVTRDKTNPILRNIAIKHAKGVEILACSEKHPWLILGNLTRIALQMTNSCQARCNSTPTFPLLPYLPFGIPSTNDTDIADEICHSATNFSKNWFIYLPSNKIDISWNSTDKESQLQSTKIGFSSNPSETDKPDIEDYKAIHGNSRYIKHEGWRYSKHEGIDNGNVFYAILKVRNKAGLETKLPVGPLIIDETPPSYTGGLQVKVQGPSIFCTWNRTSFVDPEQRHAIDEILFSIRSDDVFSTPLLQAHPKTPCPLGGAHYCFLYPLKRIQKQDAEKGLKFFFELHMFNMAGHSTVVRSEMFTVPSLHLPGKGLVIDLDRTLNDNETDVDFARPGSIMCARYTGFWHHHNLSFEVGLGTNRLSDNVSPFVRVDSQSTYCFQLLSLIALTKYYISVKATCSAGSVISSSDGFIMINETSDFHNSRVYFSSTPEYDANIRDQSFQVRVSKNPVGIHNLAAARPYTLLINTPSVHNASFRANHVIWISEATVSGDVYSRVFRPTQQNIELFFENARTGGVDIYIIHSAKAIQSTSSQESLTCTWVVAKTIKRIITSYGMTLYENGCSGQLLEESCFQPVRHEYVMGRANNHTFRNLKLKDKTLYRVGLEACFQHICMNPIYTPDIIVQFKPPAPGILRALIQNISESCVSFYFQWQTFDCMVANFSGSGQDANYEWTVSTGNNAVGSLIPWSPVSGDTDQFGYLSISSCNSIAVYAHQTLFGCIRGMCQSGAVSVLCSQIDHPPGNSYGFHHVYELDRETINTDELMLLSNSKYVGRKLSQIHALDINFCRVNIRLVGLIINAGQRPIVWYLMTEKRVPSIKCDTDIGCVTEMTSSNGYVEFHKITLREGQIYFICAFSNETTAQRELFEETFPQLSICGNGFKVDESPPMAGDVHILNQVHGFLQSPHELAIAWSGFHDGENMYPTNYHSTIKSFHYGIGTIPGRDDAVPFLEVGHSDHVMLNGLNLSTGCTYFVTVRATDYVGLTSESTSQGYTLDTTPAKEGTTVIGMAKYNSNVVAKRDLIIQWEDYEDKESGIAEFEVGIGSSKHSDDVVAFKPCHFQFIDMSSVEIIKDGVPYYILLKVTNHARLTTLFASHKFVVDSSPPEGGIVRDGDILGKADKDFQDFTDSLSCHWNGFHDPHSSVKLYRVGIGTKANRFDVEPLTGVELQLAHTWKRHFETGVKYFVTVEACNHADLCSRKHSDGIILDDSSPIPGLVHVGISSQHEKYQSHRNFIAVEWIGFQDLESDIKYFEWCIGYTQRDCDLLNYTNCLLSKSTFKSDLHLPIGKQLFVTVRAFNELAMSAVSTSDGFQVDTTAPTLVQKPEFVLNNMQISHKLGTQWEQTLLRIQWKFKDLESPITRHVVQLETHHDGRAEVGAIELEDDDHVTIQLPDKSRLLSGDVYKATITSCNAAKLCTKASTDDLLIDSTPPHLGGFKHPLQWENTRSGCRLTVTWYGFVDVESPIDTFFITAGSTYSGNDLSGGVLSFKSQTSTEQTERIQLRKNISGGNEIVLSIWANNKANLRSDIGKVTVTAVAKNKADTRGFLDIQKHSCLSQYCNNDCTCAVVGEKCSDIVLSSPCITKDYNESLNEYPYIEVLGGVTADHQTLTASSACLSGHWNVVNGSMESIQRFEWSMGYEVGSPGDGIFKGPFEYNWYDVGKERNVTHCLPHDRILQHSESYVIYVKAWFSQDTSIIYKSAPITVDTTAPSLRLGKFVMKSQDNCQTDIEFLTNSTDLTICWDQVFSDQESEVIKYDLMAGTSPYGDDFLAVREYGSLTRATFAGLQFFPGTKYFFTVRVTNSVGLTTALSSDGIVVDNELPFAGIVFNTVRFRNRYFQTALPALSVSWIGFGDHHTHIKEFVVKLIDFTLNYTVISTTVEGLENKIVFKNESINNGNMYRFLVRAVDVVGHVSATKESPFFIIDSTPPYGFVCETYGKLNISESIGNYINSSLNLGFLQFNVNLTVDNFYRLKIKFPRVLKQTNTFLSIGDHTMALQLAANHDGTLETEYAFLSPQEGLCPISITINYHTAQVMASVELSECKQMNYSLDSSVLEVRQIAPSLISVCTKAVDAESGVESVLIGAGTTPGGFQVRPLLPVPTVNHLTLNCPVTHGTRVYITVIVQNGAGLRSVFKAEPLIIDHTRPLVENITASIKVQRDNVRQNEENDTTRFADVSIKWQAIDEENGIKQCFCGLGLEHGSTTFHGLQFSDTKSGCELNDLAVEHGIVLYPLVYCTNHVELATTSVGTKLYVSYNAPDTTNAVLSYIPTNEISLPRKGIQTRYFSQTNLTFLQATWKGFEDLSEIDHYECLLREDSFASSDDWLDVGPRYAIQRKVSPKDGATYVLEVRAVNVGNRSSNPIRTTIVTDSESPRLSGHAPTVKVVGSGFELMWDKVFLTNKAREVVFDVHVGSREGYNNILRGFETNAAKIHLSVKPINHSMWVYIRAYYETGPSVTYRGTIVH